MIFEKAASKINCLVCEEQLALPTGGKSNINASPLEAVE